MGRGTRSSRTYLVIRSFFILWFPVFIFCGLLGPSWYEAAIFAGFMVAPWFFPVFFAAWFFVTIAACVLWPMFCTTEEWRRFIDSGGSPFLDLVLPWPFNPDSLRVGTRHNGITEPTESRKQAPKDWPYQCPSCGARNPTQFCVCWHCSADHTGTSYVDPNGITHIQRATGGPFLPNH